MPHEPALNPAAPVQLRRLQRADFPLLARWLATPHVRRWWNHDTTPQAIEADFGACVDGTDPAEVFVAESAWDPLTPEGRVTPLGLVQRYTFADNLGYRDELATLLPVPDGALSIDYFVGEPAALRRGWGAAMIRACVASAWPRYPAAGAVLVPVSAANTASWRVLERAGFRRVAAGPLVPDNPVDGPAHLVYRLDRVG